MRITNWIDLNVSEYLDVPRRLWVARILFALLTPLRWEFKIGVELKIGVEDDVRFVSEGGMIPFWLEVEVVVEIELELKFGLIESGGGVEKRLEFLNFDELLETEELRYNFFFLKRFCEVGASSIISKEAIVSSISVTSWRGLSHWVLLVIWLI